MLGNIARTTAPAETTLLRVLPSIEVNTLIEVVNQAWETGAISYWASFADDCKRKEVDGYNACYEFTCFDAEDDERKPLLVNVNIVKAGIEAVLNRKVGVNTDIYAGVWAGVSSGVFDTDAVDVIIQAGLFGDIVFG